MNILVTGAKGFVGRNLVANLKSIQDNKNRKTNIVIDDIFEYDIKYNATIKDHVGSAIVTIVDKLDYELDESKNNESNGGIYDSTNKTITWEIEINDVDSYKNQNNIIDIEKNITIFYKDIPTDIDKIINTVNVSTNIDEKIVEDKEEIKVIRGSLLVAYIDNKGNNLLVTVLDPKLPVIINILNLSKLKFSI